MIKCHLLLSYVLYINYTSSFTYSLIIPDLIVASFEKFWSVFNISIADLSLLLQLLFTGFYRVKHIRQFTISKSFWRCLLFSYSSYVDALFSNRLHCLWTFLVSQCWEKCWPELFGSDIVYSFIEPFFKCTPWPTPICRALELGQRAGVERVLQKPQFPQL